MRIRLLANVGLAIAAALFVSSAVQAQVCNESYAALFLNIQGADIAGEHPCTTLERSDSILVLGFGSSSIPLAASPTFPTFNGFHPVTFVKPQDKSTPSLFQALVTLAAVDTAEFRFYTTAGGSAEHTYTVTLGNAVVSSISSAVGSKDEEPTEAVSIAFGSATWTDVVNGTEHTWTSSP